MISFSIIIQARTGSSRLPEKMLLPFYNGSTILELVIDNLLKSFKPQNIILATTTNNKDLELVKVANKKGINHFQGNENNVLERFIKCAEHFNATKIVRVCADNPFLDTTLLLQLLDSIKDENVNYASYHVSNTPTIRTHFGFFAEYVSLKALLQIQKSTSDSFYQEHVTNYIYNNPSEFNILWKPVPEIISSNNNIRLTVDTKEDFETCQYIYQSLQKTNTLDFENVIGFINNNQSLKKGMIEQIEKYAK